MNPLRDLDPSKGQRFFVETVPHSVALGLQFVASGNGWVQLALPWREDLVGDPDSGVVHGGVITTLVDACCGSAVLTALPELQRIVTLDLRIDYLRPAAQGQRLRCRAECYRLTRQVAFVRAVVDDGDEADPVATSAATFMVLHQDRSVIRPGATEAAS